jgi:hypothetical protein
MQDTTKQSARLQAIRLRYSINSTHPARAADDAGRGVGAAYCF